MSRRLPLAAAIALVLMAACDSGSSERSGPDTTVPETTSSMAASTATDPAPTVPRPPTTAGGKRLNVALPAGGPPDQVSPPPVTPAYELLFSNRCQELLDLVVQRSAIWTPTNRFLYRGAAHACLKHWDEAQKDYDSLKAELSSSGQSFDAAACPDESDPKALVECEACKAAAYEWLGSLLAARAKDPAFSPVFVKAPASKRICAQAGNGA